MLRGGGSGWLAFGSCFDATARFCTRRGLWAVRLLVMEDRPRQVVWLCVELGL